MAFDYPVHKGDRRLWHKVIVECVEEFAYRQHVTQEQLESPCFDVKKGLEREAMYRLGRMCTNFIVQHPGDFLFETRFEELRGGGCFAHGRVLEWRICVHKVAPAPQADERAEQ